jgi:hypothetical protein
MARMEENHESDESYESGSDKFLSVGFVRFVRFVVLYFPIRVIRDIRGSPQFAQHAGRQTAIFLGGAAGFFAGRYLAAATFHTA